APTVYSSRQSGVASKSQPLQAVAGPYAAGVAVVRADFAGKKGARYQLTMVHGTSGGQDQQCSVTITAGTTASCTFTASTTGSLIATFAPQAGSSIAVNLTVTMTN